MYINVAWKAERESRIQNVYTFPIKLLRFKPLTCRNERLVRNTVFLERQ